MLITLGPDLGPGGTDKNSMGITQVGVPVYHRAHTPFMLMENLVTPIKLSMILDWETQ